MVALKEESSTVQSLKDEFTQRIADAERKAQLACKERDIAKKVTSPLELCDIYTYVYLKCPSQTWHFSLLQEIKGLREELSTRLNSSDTMEIIREKEEQIRGLLEEGEAHWLCALWFSLAGQSTVFLFRLGLL